jgi:hypothetical protein
MFPSSRVNACHPGRSAAQSSRNAAGKAGEAGLSNPVELRPANHRARRLTDPLPGFTPKIDVDVVIDEKMFVSKCEHSSNSR